MLLTGRVKAVSRDAGPFVEITPGKLSPSSFPLKLEGEVDLQGTTYESPTYQDGLVLISSGIKKNPSNISDFLKLFINNNPNVSWYGINANTGTIVWSQPARKNYARRCINSEHLVVSSNPSPFDSTQSSSSLMVFEPLEGKLVWQREDVRTVICSDSLVILGESRGWIEAMDIGTGQERWSGTTPTLGFSHWRIIYNSSTNQFFVRAATLSWDYYFIDAATGKLGKIIPKTDIEPNASSGHELFSDMLFIDNGRMFMNIWPDNGKDFVAVLDAQSGNVLHREPRYGLFISHLVGLDAIYAYTEEMGIVAIDKDSYELKWNYPQPQHSANSAQMEAVSSLVQLNGIGYIIFADATLRAIDLENGQELGYWQPTTLDLPKKVKAGVAASEDKLFVSFGDGKLYIFGK